MAKAWVPDPFAEACGLLAGNAATAGMGEMGTGWARRPGTKSDVGRAGAAPGDQVAGKVLMDSVEASRTGGGGGMGKVS